MPAASEIDDASASAGSGERLYVNKNELAQKILACSVITVNALIARYPDFPIEQRGTNGVQWRFDADAVTTFLQEKRRASGRAGASREALFEQFRLPLDEMDAPDAAGLTPAQRLALAKAIEIERRNDLEAGKLVRADELCETLGTMVGRLVAMLDSIPSQVGHECNLSDDAIRRIRQSINAARASFVREMERDLAVPRDAAGQAASPRQPDRPPSPNGALQGVSTDKIDMTFRDIEEEAPQPMKGRR